MISVIMPTMWKPTLILKTIKEIVEHQAVGELIIIDNSNSESNPFDVFHTKFEKVVYVKATNEDYIQFDVAKYDTAILINDSVEDLSFLDEFTK